MRRQPAALPEQRKERPDGTYRAQHVDVEDPGPIVFGQRVDGSELLHPDVGAKDVATTQRALNMERRCLDRGRISDVDPERRRRHVECPGQGNGLLLGCVLIDVEESDGRSSLCEARVRGPSQDLRLRRSPPRPCPQVLVPLPTPPRSSGTVKPQRLAPTSLANERSLPISPGAPTPRSCLAGRAVVEYL